MISKIIKELSDKNILILGFGREGKSTYNFIRKYLKNKKLTIADFKDLKNDELIIGDENLELKTGEDYLKNLEKYDLIIKTPGISLKDIKISKIKSKIISQLELLLKYTKSKTIGITGTKGKSTTSTLIYDILKAQKSKVILCGNIGIPIFDIIEEIEEDTIIVLELSAHQLEFVNYSPKITIFLNIYEEHLDHFGDYDSYINAKCQIYKNQKKGNYLLYNFDSKIIKSKLEKEQLFAKKVGVTFLNDKTIPVNNDMINNENNWIYYNNEKIYDVKSERKLLGDHNLNDIMFGLGVSKILKLDMDKVSKTIEEFDPLEHRMEYVGEINNIKYYNDSISTIPEATINAVKSIKDVDTLIIGGMDRGIDYTKLINFLNTKEVKNVICMPATGHKIAEKLKFKAYNVENLEEAVKLARKIAEKKCLLSPAAASYGYFKNFEERGKKFKQLVRE